MAFSNSQILQMSSSLFERLPDLLRHFNIEYTDYPNRVSFPCPIHGGDNLEACTIFTDGNTVKGNWNCWTQHCEEEFSRSLFGFVRGALSANEGEKVSIYEAANFCLKFLKMDISQIKAAEPNEINNDIRLLEIFERSPHREKAAITRDEIISSIKIPSQYYINRGYEAKTLEKFDVGLCDKKNKPMYRRIVVPIYDEGYNYIGCIGRASTSNMEPKWLYSRGFKKSAYLYGLNLAKEEILKTGVAFIVEGQGDVWRMHEAGIKNSVGIFGSNLSDDQLVLLEQSGAMSLIILTDSDEAGERAAVQIMQKCGRRFNYHRPPISEKDIGDMTKEQIQEEVLNKLEGVM